VTTVYAIHETDATHLEDVIVKMRKMGAPTIRVVDCFDFFMALEGSHRLAAAAKLGLTPTFVVFEQDDIVDLSDLDIDTYNINLGETYTAGELAGELIGMHNPKFSFCGS
jgi:hypothetical protein